MKYQVVKENYSTGEQAKRTRTLIRNDVLTIGGLYFHLGRGFRGCYRILEEMTEEKE